jgi:hypothetical protein
MVSDDNENNDDQTEIVIVKTVSHTATKIKYATFLHIFIFRTGRQKTIQGHFHTGRNNS